MWLPCVACTTIPSSHSRTSLHTIAPGGADVPGDVRTACFLVWQERFCSLFKGAEAGQGLYAAGKCKAQSCTCGRAFPWPAAGWSGCGAMLCFPTDAALYNNGERSLGNRSAVHVPTQRAAPVIAACCIGYRTVVPSGSEKQSLREVKSAKCKVKNAARWPEVQCLHRASPILNSKFSIHN